MMRSIQWTAILVLCAIFCLPVYAAPVQGAAGTGQVADGGVPFAPAVQEVRLTRIALLTAIADARMEGTITYIGGISGSAGTGELSVIREEFAAASAELMQDTARADVRQDRALLLQIRNEFRNETREMMNQYDGNRTALQEAVRSSIAAHNGTISAIREELDGNRDTAAMAIFDWQTGRGERRLGLLEGQGLDTTVPAGTLAEIEAQRDPLAAALASNDRDAIRGEREMIRGLAKEFRQQVRAVATGQDGQKTSAD